MQKGLVLLSGGIDSATAAWIASKECDELYALTFRYGQRSEIKELGCALRLGKKLGVTGHKVLDILLDGISDSSLVGGGGGIWVPQRNSIFLAIAYAWAETLGCNRVYIGVSSNDCNEFPDCRPEFVSRIEEALNSARKDGYLYLLAPLLLMNKTMIIRKGLELGVPFEDTWSCYEEEGSACGECLACKKRLEAFKEAGLEDPIEYKGD